MVESETWPSVELARRRQKGACDYRGMTMELSQIR
jgi:hypothetical protein